MNICNNQLAAQLDDGYGTQDCPSGGCGCMLAGEKNSRWFRIVIQTGGVLEFTINAYNGSADYDFSVWNQGAGGSCPSSAEMDAPDRCNYAAPQNPTGIRGTGNGNSNDASGNLFSNQLNVSAGDVIYILVDNWSGTNVGFQLDFFGGSPGSGKGTTATFQCDDVNTCSTCSDPDCNTYRFDTPEDYSFDETAANGACHSNFPVNSKTATVCGTFTVPAPLTTVEFPLDAGVEITTTGNTAACLDVATSHISYQVWGICGTPISPIPGTGIYTGLDNSTTYKVCKTVDVSSGSADCYLSRICLPYWTMVENDDPCSAIPLTIDATAISGSTVGASTGMNAGCTGYQDVWYSFIAPNSGRVQINVNPDATSDVKVSLIGPLAGTESGVNDCNQTCDQITTLSGGCNDYNGIDGTERLFAFVIPGQEYYVWVSGTAARPDANFTIRVTETITTTAQPTPGPDLVGTPDVIPSNDDCSNAIDLNPMCNTQSGTNIGATAICTDPDPQYVAAITLENDVWYKWTAPADNGNAQVTLEVTGVSCTDGAGVGATGIQFGIFRGTCSALTPVQSGTTTLTFTPIAGETYYFVIDGNAGAQCNFSINIKRPTVTSQTCSGGNYCAGSSISASFNYSYSGSNPGYRWAYCKSSTWGSACTIDLDNPSTYSIYDAAVGLPNPGCTPATYTFVGYILADNGATTIAPGYPRPQPISANCVRQTNPCTFNIYPDISNTVTVTATNCSQIVTTNAACSPAAPITISGNTNQTASPGTNGTFTPVTVTWNAPYAASAPSLCNTYTIQNNYACPGPSGANTCSAAPQLIIGAPAISSNNTVTATTAEWVTACGTGNAGSGVWFTFVAPNSGNVNIYLTNVGSGNNLDAMLYLFDSRLSRALDCTTDFEFESDICASCTDLGSGCDLDDQLIYCSDLTATNGNESIQARYLNPGETYYIMVDGYYTPTNVSTGNFSINITDAGGGPTRPTNDDCLGAIDITSNCSPFQGNNIDATSNCSSDLYFPGASTENSVWYTYTASVTGPHVIYYRYANGTHCAFYGAQPGIQFSLYTSSNNACTGTFTNIPAGTVSTGTTNGSVTVNLVAGQKYYIFIDGYGGNECEYEFLVYSKDLCCTADLGATEGNDVVLCYGDEVTYGVSADPIDFGDNAEDNPVIGWQFSTTEPTVINPFDPANNGKSYYVGQIDIASPGTSVNKVYRDMDGYFPSPPITLDNNGNSTYYSATINDFPAGATFNTATDTITLCVNLGMQYYADLDLDLVAPDGSLYRLVHDKCGSDYGYLNVCFSNVNTIGNINSAACPGGGEITGYYLPMDAWAGLNGEGLNGTWRLRVEDDASGDYTYFYGFNLDIKKSYTTTSAPVVGTHHGDIRIVNDDPFKYGSQTFWLTPVTFIDYDESLNLVYTDSCYSYGTPVKVTLLEKLNLPNYTPTCNAPGDGSNGVSLTVTSPTGGWPGLTPDPTPPQYFTVSGAGAASSISFPSPPVDENEVSNSFTVNDGEAWSVIFTDNNGCQSSIGSTFEKPNLGSILINPTICDDDSLTFSVSSPPPVYAIYKITIDFDGYPQDISWVMYNGTNTIVASGGGYSTTDGAASITTPLLDPNLGPYRIEFFDGYGDGLGSGGGTSNNGGSTTSNFILIEELLASGGSTVLYNQNYSFCTPIYCVGPTASLFSNLNINLGTPLGTYSTGVSASLHNGSTCGGSAISGGVSLNSDASGAIHSNVSGVNGGSTYSLEYSYTDNYGCTTSLCSPVTVFPRLSINPSVTCDGSQPIVNVNATCSGCNATFVAEYSYNGGATWTTATSANFQDIFTFGHVRNTLTNEVACEVS
ncbi:MAG: proprotein convertase P-domain-containing protein, partial [Bacteroidetes bacterium]|nr:proprotein convertase P-domain-containing protein [Bacteroidota bacterium]